MNAARRKTLNKILDQLRPLVDEIQTVLDEEPECRPILRIAFLLCVAAISSLENAVSELESCIGGLEEAAEG